MARSGLALLVVLSATEVLAQPDDDPFGDMPIEAGELPAAAPPAAEPEPAERDIDEWFGNFEVELRVFAHDPGLARQPARTSTAFAFRPGYLLEPTDWLTLRTSGLARVDESDPERSTADLREAIAQVRRGPWTATLGIHKVFWGVTESRHLVDIINQVDYREDLDGDERHGQLMAMASYETGAIGLIDAIAATWFRPQTYPGLTGRPGLPLPVSDEAIYESSRERWNVDLAVRWSRSLGDFEGALSYFYGTAREPELVPGLIGAIPALVPFYDRIHQGGLELSWTRKSWQWKLESIVRRGQGPTFAAVTGGLEKTFGDVADGADLTLFAEYNYDGRDNLTFSLYENHAFAAVRVSLNDPAGTEATAGALVDVRDGDTFGFLEASRRLGGGWKTTIEGRIFASSGDQSDALYWFRRDHYIEATLQYFY